MRYKKYSEADGYGIYTPDFQARDSKLDKVGYWLSDNAIEIIMTALFLTMMAGVGLLMSTAATAVDAAAHYVELNDELLDDNYQMQQVIEALQAQPVEPDY